MIGVKVSYQYMIHVLGSDAERLKALQIGIVEHVEQLTERALLLIANTGVDEKDLPIPFNKPAMNAQCQMRLGIQQTAQLQLLR